ncbi:MAG: thioredoxin domain-containing protein, partial [Burkholderiales bacterium]
KMLYDNGPLLALYADAWALTGKPLFRRVAQDTATWAMREMQSPQGGYYSSLDADSEHEEGKFYVWSRQEAAALLTVEEYAVVSAHYGLAQAANFEDRHWHLYVAQTLPAVTRALAMEEERAAALLEIARGKLFGAREKRVRPGRDDKVLASWNALMIQGMARAARIFGRADWRDSAQRAFDFVTSRMRDGTRLLASYKDGRAHLNAYLDDYAFLAEAALELLQTEFRPQTFQVAVQLADALLEQFEDRDAGGFHFTSHDHERLILRPKPGHDNATPSGNGVAALVLARLGHVLGEPRYLQAAQRTVQVFFPLMAQRAAGFATLATALADVLTPTRSVVLRGPKAELERWAARLAGRFLPDTLVLAVDSEQQNLPPVLAKPAGAGVNAYLCEGVSCSAPLTDLDQLLQSVTQGRLQ